MKQNIIVLTTGASGSSVITGIISTQGYWLGEDTKKLHFNTYENAELVDLNIRILRAAGFSRFDCNDIPPPDIQAIKNVIDRIDLKPFTDFIEKCSRFEPWVWKDPRLSFTIHFWDQLIDVKKVKHIFLDRNPKQSYAGLILSRKVPMSYREQIIINSNYRKSCQEYYKKHTLKVKSFTFEDLILSPHEFIKEINQYLGAKIVFEDLTKIYKGDFYKNRYNLFSLLRSNIYYFLYVIKGEKIKFPRQDILKK